MLFQTVTEDVRSNQGTTLTKVNEEETHRGLS